MNSNTTPRTARTDTPRLERPRHGRVVAGVATAVANRSSGSVGFVRFGFIVATLLAGLGALVYAAAWALLPDEGEPQSPAARWFDGLSTPGRRLASLLIGLAALIVIAATAPVSALAAVALLVGVAVLAPPQSGAAVSEVAIERPSNAAETAGPESEAQEE